MKHRFDLFPNEVFIETGTWVGEGIQAALSAGCFQELYSIEISPALYSIAKEKFKRYPQVHCLLGDSLDVLPWILKEKVPNKLITFWLDAHYSGGKTSFGRVRVPILQEIRSIGEHEINSHTILVDDMRAIGKSTLPDDGWNSITLEDIEKEIYKINPNYQITYGFGVVPNDILIAQLL